MMSMFDFYGWRRLLTATVVGVVLSGIAAPAATAALAVPVTLAWGAADDPTVAGYAIYYGPTNQVATNRVDAGVNLRVTIFNLQASRTYKFYAVSYNAAKVESMPSNQVLVTSPVISKLQISRLTDGNMRLAFKAAPGTSCRIQYASKPTGAPWQTLTSTTTDLVGQAAVTDSGAKLVSSRFYRAVTP